MSIEKHVKVSNWNGMVCEVTSVRNPTTSYKVDLDCLGESLCGHKSMENRCGLCVHVVAAVMHLNERRKGYNTPPLVYKDFLPKWQWLDTWAKQLGVPLSQKSEEDDLRYFLLPNMSDVLKTMQTDETLDRTCVSATGKLKGQLGRMKGTVEEMRRRTKRVQDEVQAGRKTGVDTTPMNAPLKKANLGPKCLMCSRESGWAIYKADCGGAQNRHLGSDFGKRRFAAENQKLKDKQAKACKAAEQALQRREAQLASSMLPPPPMPPPMPQPQLASMLPQPQLASVLPQPQLASMLPQPQLASMLPRPSWQASRPRQAFRGRAPPAQPQGTLELEPLVADQGDLSMSATYEPAAAAPAAAEPAAAEPAAAEESMAAEVERLRRELQQAREDAAEAAAAEVARAAEAAAAEVARAAAAEAAPEAAAPAAPAAAAAAAEVHTGTPPPLQA